MPLPISTLSRRRVEDELRRLRAEFGEFEVVEKVWHHPTDDHDRVVDRFEAGTVGSADCWIANDEGRVLLVRPCEENAWGTPGGEHEYGETIEETAVRTTRDETGLECRIDGVALVQAIEYRPEGSDEPGVVRLHPIFEGSYRGGTLEYARETIADARWFDRHPEALLYEELADLEIPAAGATGGGTRDSRTAGGN